MDRLPRNKVFKIFDQSCDTEFARVAFSSQIRMELVLRACFLRTLLACILQRAMQVAFVLQKDARSSFLYSHKHCHLTQSPCGSLHGQEDGLARESVIHFLNALNAGFAAW